MAFTSFLLLYKFLFPFLINPNNEASVVLLFLINALVYLYTIYFFANSYLPNSINFFSIISCTSSTKILFLFNSSIYWIIIFISSLEAFSFCVTSLFAFSTAIFILDLSKSTTLPSLFITFNFNAFSFQ